MKVLLLFYFGGMVVWGVCREGGEMGDKLLGMSIVITAAASIFGKDGGNIVNLCVASIYGRGVDWRKGGV